MSMSGQGEIHSYRHFREDIRVVSEGDHRRVRRHFTERAFHVVVALPVVADSDQPEVETGPHEMNRFVFQDGDPDLFQLPANLLGTPPVVMVSQDGVDPGPGAQARQYGRDLASPDYA